MNIINHLHTFIIQHELIKPHDTIIIGLSGGPDSVFLTTALHQLQAPLHLKLIAAHLNHEWRPEAVYDSVLCAQLCAQLNIPLISRTRTQLNWHPTPDPGSQEARGRLMRRFFFEQVYKEYNATSIALAHHRQDQEETFFIRLVRGATLDGLTGMKPREGHYIRPLLTVNKEDILSYLKEHGIPFALDATNESSAHLRNRIRQLVIPALRACDARFDHQFERALTHLQEANEFIEEHAAHELNQCLDGDNKALSIRCFLQKHPFIQRRMLVQWLCMHQVPFTLTTSFLHEVLKFFHAPRAQEHRIHDGWKLVKSKGYLSIKKT